MPGALRRDLRKSALRGWILKPVFKCQGAREGSANEERVLKALPKHLEHAWIADVGEGSLRIDALARPEENFFLKILESRAHSSEFQGKIEEILHRFRISCCKLIFGVAHSEFENLYFRNFWRIAFRSAQRFADKFSDHEFGE